MKTKKLTPKQLALCDMRAEGLSVSFFAHDTCFDGRCLNGRRDLENKTTSEDETPITEMCFNV